MRNAFALSLLIALCILKTDAFTTSIHLNYQPKGDVTAFQCQITVLPNMDPVNTFYMAIGFEGGYFGIQTKAEDERWINYSVWDGDGGAAKLIEKGPDVIQRAFSHEGSGIQTYRVHFWETDVPQSFMVTVKPSQEGHAVFSGYFLINGKWNLMASIERPGHSPYLTNVHSFLENFGKDNSHMRQARYSNIFYQLKGTQEWHPVKEAVTLNAPQTNPDDSWNHSVDSKGFVMEIDGKTGTKTRRKRLTFSGYPGIPFQVPRVKKNSRFQFTRKRRRTQG
jgi:hypothetical protein